MSNLPFITIVMPVKNEGSFIEKTLKQLLMQDYPNDLFEIIVVDGNSDDGTREIVAKLSMMFPQIKLKDNPKGLSSAGRNIGFSIGRGDIFLVVDGHCYIDNNQLLKNIVKCFEKNNVQCLGRPQPLDPPGLTLFQKAVSLARASRIGHSIKSFIYSDYEGFVSPVSVGAIYKKEVFEKIGYVDEGFDACEDIEFNYLLEKSGYKGYISPSLTIKYYPRGTLKDLFNQMKRYGRGRFKFIRKHPEVINLDMLILPSFVFGLFLLPCFIMGAKVFSLQSLSIFIRFSSVTLLTLYSLYFLLIQGESIRIATTKGFCYFRYLPFIFFVIHFGLGWGFIEGIFDSLIRGSD
jgi:glycosyltransferase involved in cell wall biosynthesis